MHKPMCLGKTCVPVPKQGHSHQSISTFPGCMKDPSWPDSRCIYISEKPGDISTYPKGFSQVLCLKLQTSLDQTFSS